MNRGLIPALALFLSIIAYYLLGYEIERHQSVWLITTFSILFGVYLWFAFKSKINLTTVFVIGILFRLVMLFAFPNLSDDVFRFLWDGHVWAAGVNPFAYLPTHFYDGTVAQEFSLPLSIFYKLNSPDHYTVYPSLPQFINLAAVSLFPNSIYWSVVMIKIPLLAAELGSFYFLRKLLRNGKKKVQLISLCFLNPLVVLEILGNAHHEGLMICFLLGFLFFLGRNQLLIAGSMLAFSVASKLLPLMFLPLILFLVPSHKWVRIFSSFLTISILLLVPLLDSSFVHGMLESLTLYYQKLEFNGSLYFLVREIGYWQKGYNIIASSGKGFAMVSFISILIYSGYAQVRNIELPQGMLFVYLIFALFSLILHPWYILILIPLGILSGYIFPVVWSYLIFLTYIGYSVDGYTETPLIFWIEYCVLGILILLESKSFSKLNQWQNSP